MYRTVEQLDTVIADLADRYPSSFDLVRLPETTIEGRTVTALRMRLGPREDGSADRPAVLVVGGTHARELMNPDAIVELIVELFTSYRRGTDLSHGNKTWTAAEITEVVENLDLWFLPCVNPDGRHHVLTADDMWRKNRRPNENRWGFCDGVDINRNSEILWGVTEGQTSCSPCSQVYCGTAPASEPETRNVRHLLDLHPMVAFVDVHSFSELVLRPWGHANNQTTDPEQRFTKFETGTCRALPGPEHEEYIPAGDLDWFINTGNHVVAAIEAVRGRRYSNQTGMGLYPTTGTLSDYAYARHIADPTATRTYGYTFETGPDVGNPRDSFHPPDPTAVKADARSGLVALLQRCVGLEAVAGNREAVAGQERTG